MQRLQDQSIKIKLVLLTGASVGLALLLSTLGFIGSQARTIRSAKLRQLESLADVLALSSTEILTSRDAPAAEQLLASVRLQPTVEFACLYDGAGDVLATCGEGGGQPHGPPPAGESGQRLGDSGRLELVRKVVDHGHKAGTLYLRANMDDVRARLWHDVLIAAAVAAFSLAAAVWLSVRLQRAISVPILRLASAAREVTSAGNCSLSVEREAKDEIGGLYAAFNHVLERVQTTEEALRKAHAEMDDRVRQRTAQLSAEIAERKSTQAELVRAKNAAEAASQAKSQFLANMSHEIRTPLNAILGFSDLLQKGADEGDQDARHEYLQTIVTSGKHLLSLINDILDLSKIEADRWEMEQIRCSPHELIAEVVSVLRVRAQRKGLSLEYEWQGGVPETILTDPARLRQLLMNLVGNAVKFTEVGYVRIVVYLTSSKDRPRLAFKVIDTGIGIPAEKLDKIFDPFIQADNSVTREFGGTGLGLAISRRIAEALGGRLTVRSRVGKGSIFRATIDPGPLEGIKILDGLPADVRSRHRRVPDERNLALPPAKVLLVEDGETNRKLISLVLQRAGLEVMAAENGQIGVELAKNGHFDVILMDMQMPVMDGYTAARRLRQDGITAPIIALTAHAMKGDEEKCKQAGCSGYLTKPVDTDRLVQTLAGALHGCRVEAADDAACGPAAPQPTSPSPEQSPGDHAPLTSKLPLHDAAFRRIVRKFVKRLDERLEAMQRAWEADDLVEVERLSHWLKGTGGTAGFPPLSEAARKLNDLAKQRQRDRMEAALKEVLDLAGRIQAPEEEPADADA